MCVGTLLIVSEVHTPTEIQTMPDRKVSNDPNIADPAGIRVTTGSQAATGQRSVIHWRGLRNPGASPLAVLQATKVQMEREQQSDLGSDANAKALALVNQAVAELEGKQTSMPDGTPIIQ